MYHRELSWVAVRGLDKARAQASERVAFWQGQNCVRVATECPALPPAPFQQQRGPQPEAGSADFGTVLVCHPLNWFVGDVWLLKKGAFFCRGCARVCGWCRVWDCVEGCVPSRRGPAVLLSI